MNVNRDKKIELRVTEEEKVKIQELAKSAGLDVSSLIREAVLTDKKLTLLTDGTAIAKGISELTRAFTRAYQGGHIDGKYCPVLLASIEELVGLINQLMDKLPDLCDDSE